MNITRWSGQKLGQLSNIHVTQPGVAFVAGSWQFSLSEQVTGLGQGPICPGPIPSLPPWTEKKKTPATVYKLKEELRLLMKFIRLDLERNLKLFNKTRNNPNPNPKNTLTILIQQLNQTYILLKSLKGITLKDYFFSKMTLPQLLSKFVHVFMKFNWRTVTLGPCFTVLIRKMWQQRQRQHFLLRYFITLNYLLAHQGIKAETLCKVVWWFTDWADSLQQQTTISATKQYFQEYCIYSAMTLLRRL